MRFHSQQTSCIPFLTLLSTRLWCEGRELSPWTQWTLWPVMTNGQAVGRGADMCLCFQPSLLRLISAPAATVGAPVPHSPQHPGLDQSTMWLRPGARRARDRQAGGRQRAETRRKAWHTTHIYNHFIFNSICQIWWLELFIKALLLQNFWSIFKGSAHYSWAVGVMWGQDNEQPPHPDLSSLNWSEQFHQRC